ATITGATTTAGTLSYPVALPYRGFYLAGNPAGAFDATVTVTLAAPANTKFNVCVYASDYPPNATLQSNGSGYVLHGTPPFVINGSIREPSYTFNSTGVCITSITDSTGCPGFVVNPPIVPGSIPSTGETVCAGAAPATIVGLMPFGGGDGQLAYSWYKDNVLIPDATGANYTPPPADAATAGTYVYTRKVNDRTCGVAPLASEGSWALIVGEAPATTLTASSPTVCEGAAVTLTATAGAASYSFNGDAWLAGNTTTVTVTATTVYTVKARSAAGCESAEATTTVTANAVPTVSASSPTRCGAGTVLLTATAANTTTPCSYTWTVAGAAPVITPTNTYTTPSFATSGAARTYSVFITNDSGCTSTVANGTFMVHVIPTIEASSPTHCGPGNVELMTAANNLVSPCTYTWNIENRAAPIMTECGYVSLTMYFAESKTYSVFITNASGCTSTVANGSVTLLPPSTLSLSASSDIVCKNTSVTLTATPGAASYSFDGGAWQASNTTTVTVTATKTYTAKARYVSACESEEATTTVTVEEAPSVSLDVSSADVCVGSSATLTATPGAASYSFNGGVWQTSNTTTVTVTATTTYTVKARSAHGCESTETRKTITAHAIPTISTNSPSRCGTGNLDLTVTANNRDAPCSYTWTIESVAPFTTTCSFSTHTRSFSESKTYSVSILNGYGCSNTAYGTATVNPVPAVSASSPTRCGAGTVSLTATPTNATSPATYSWIVGGAAAVTTPANTYTTGSLNGNTTYSVTIRNSTGCTSTAANGTVTVGAVPVIPSAEPANRSACSGASVTFSITAQTGVTYTWYKADGSLQGSGNSYTTGTAGRYYAIATHNSGCTATSRTATATLSGTGAAIGAQPTDCGCAAGLEVSTDCGTCFPIIPAGTLTVSACNLQVITRNFASTVTCPTGWRDPTWNEMACIAENNASGAYIMTQNDYQYNYYYTSSTNAGGFNCAGNTCCTSGTAIMGYRYKMNSNPCSCGGGRNGDHAFDPYVPCSSTCFLKKCVKNL
ncbi:MAG: hypothetical protein LBF90_00005, partial [Prevotellaceae bacterium]|nr:hypothetical protein [Prevotellaceae bacterium]